MTKERKSQLLKLLESEIVKAKANAQKADEASKFKISGPSESGDKYHSEKAADLALGYLKNLEGLKKEIEAAREVAVNRAEPVCYVEVQFTDLTSMNFILVEKAVSMTGYLFLSTESPLGKAVFGKGVGSAFNYRPQSSDNSADVSGKIIAIE